MTARPTTPASDESVRECERLCRDTGIGLSDSDRTAIADTLAALQAEVERSRLHVAVNCRVCSRTRHANVALHAEVETLRGKRERAKDAGA